MQQIDWNQMNASNWMQPSECNQVNATKWLQVSECNQVNAKQYKLKLTFQKITLETCKYGQWLHADLNVIFMYTSNLILTKVS